MNEDGRRVLRNHEALETWTFILALSFALNGVPNAQLVAETWRLCCALIWEDEFGRTRIRSFPRIQTWGVSICKRTLKRACKPSNKDVVYAVATHLAGILAKAVSSTKEGELSIEALLNVAKHRSRSKTELNALREIESLADQISSSDRHFLVESEQTASSFEIMVERGEISRSLDDYWVAPHRFCVKNLRTHDSKSELYVGQIVRHRGTRSCPTEWDTIVDDNEMYPFWPRAGGDGDATLCHRCATHQDGDDLAWSDWPQVDAQLRRRDIPVLEFTTGLFAGRQEGSIQVFQLISKVKWCIDWSKLIHLEQAPWKEFLSRLGGRLVRAGSQ